MGLIFEEQNLINSEHSIENSWLYKKALEMSNEFSLVNYARNKNRNNSLYFFNIDSSFRVYVKMYIYSLIIEERHGEKSATSEFSKLKEFIDFLNKEQFVYDIKDIKESDVLSYIEKQKYLISNMFTLENGITIETGHKKLATIKKFLLEMYNEGILELSFIEKIDVSKSLPLKKPHFYYKGDVLEKYYELKEKKHNDKTLEYSTFIEILESMSNWNDEKLECLITILANTGLRISEALNLDVNCYTETTNVEYESFYKNNINFEIMSCDKKGLYWLDNYFVSKKKKGEWEQGNPILIGQKTKEAIDNLTILSEDARESLKGKHGETKIFANFYNKKATVLSRATFAKKRDYICENLGVPRFSFHQFRHTFAKILYDSGIPISFIKKYLNHIYTDMTAYYINTSIHDKMKTYVEFVESEHISSQNKKAKELHNEFKEAMDSEYFQAMALDNRLELLDMIIDNKEIGVNVMDHGICLLPHGTQCPNNFLEVNSCLDNMCEKFMATENSISHLDNLIKYRRDAIRELEELNFKEAVSFNKEKLSQLNNTLSVLKGSKNE